MTNTFHFLANFALPYPKERKKVYEFENKGVTIPPPYNFRKRHRAPVVLIGYRAFTKRGGEYFEGNLLGGVRASPLIQFFFAKD